MGGGSLPGWLSEPLTVPLFVPLAPVEPPLVLLPRKLSDSVFRRLETSFSTILSEYSASLGNALVRYLAIERLVAYGNRVSNRNTSYTRSSFYSPRAPGYTSLLPRVLASQMALFLRGSGFANFHQPISQSP